MLSIKVSGFWADMPACWGYILRYERRNASFVMRRAIAEAEVKDSDVLQSSVQKRASSLLRDRTTNDLHGQRLVTSR